MLVLVTEVVPLQFTVASFILPKIGLTFPSVGSNVSWTVTIAGIVGGATIALVGKAGDVFGKKRVLIMLAAFCAAGSLLSAVAPNWVLFLTGRGIAGVSLGMAVLNLSLIRDLMPRRWIPIAVGFVGTGFAISGIIGPLIFGALTDHYSWRSVYWFLLIYGVVITLLFAVIVPESPVRVRQRFDIPGAVLFGAGIAGVSFYLSEGGSWGWGNGTALAYLIGGLAVLAVFVGWELRAASPMLDLALIRRPAVYLVVISGFFITGLQSVFSIIVSYLFLTPPQSQLQQQIIAGAAAKAHYPAAVVAPFAHFNGPVSGAGYSVLQLAYHITIWQAVFTVIAAPLGGWLCRRIGARIPLIIAGVTLTAAGALWVGWHSTWQEQVAIGVLFGIGGGFNFAAWPNLIMDSVPAGLQGIAGGMVQVSGSIGTSVSAALIASIEAAHQFHVVFAAPGRPPLTQPIPQVYTDAAFSQAYLLLGAIPAAIVIVIAIVLRSGRTPARGGAPVEAPEAVPAQA
jgi:MFS family permease